MARLDQLDYVEFRTDTWGGSTYELWVDGLTLY
jgi:hypothetical protein